MRKSRRHGLFLAELAKRGNVTQAAKAAGVDRTWAYQQRHKRPEFAQSWDTALEIAADALEAEAWNRAVSGWDEPLASAGKWIHDDAGEPAYIHRYSDRLLEVLLRGARPAKYGTKQLQVSGQVDHRLIPSRDGAAVVQELLAQVGDNPEARDAISKAFLALAAPRIVEAES